MHTKKCIHVDSKKKLKCKQISNPTFSICSLFKNQSRANFKIKMFTIYKFFRSYFNFYLEWIKQEMPVWQSGQQPGQPRLPLKSTWAAGIVSSFDDTIWDEAVTDKDGLAICSDRPGAKTSVWTPTLVVDWHPLGVRWLSSCLFFIAFIRLKLILYSDE